MKPELIIHNAIKQYRPKKCVIMLSGGHDSITNAHISAQILSSKGIQFEVYHGDTTIGIPETQQYVRSICSLYGWKLNIRLPPDKKDYYQNIVAEYGFPGRTKVAHQFMYRRLKERALRSFVTHECKSKPSARENIMLLSGVRRDESRIRMGYQHVAGKDGSRVWVNPIFYLTEDDCGLYMNENQIPRNPVKEKICISGECLCGCFAAKEEFSELKEAYPHVAKRIEELHSMAVSKGFPWRWGQGPNEWKRESRERQQISFDFLCAECNRRG